jgi:integration host factor subunit alpha
MYKKNLTRKKIAQKINQKVGFSKNFSLKIIDDTFELLKRELSISNKIKIKNFGTFLTQTKNERVGRNPKPKIMAKISARKVVKFKPSSMMKKKINNYE